MSKILISSLLMSSIAFAEPLEEKPYGVLVLEGQVLTKTGPVSVGPGLFLNTPAVNKLDKVLVDTKQENEAVIKKYNDLVDLYNDRPSNLVIGLLAAGGLIVGTGLGIGLALGLKKN